MVAFWHRQSICRTKDPTEKVVEPRPLHFHRSIGKTSEKASWHQGSRISWIYPPPNANHSVNLFTKPTTILVRTGKAHVVQRPFEGKHETLCSPFIISAFSFLPSPLPSLLPPLSPSLPFSSSHLLPTVPIPLVTATAPTASCYTDFNPSHQSLGHAALQTYRRTCHSLPLHSSACASV